MSTGLECLFFEHQPRIWYYLLEDWDSPKGAWDWREHSTCYGPFPTKVEAREHLNRNHANPGGSCTREFDPAQRADATLDRLVTEAVSPQPRSEAASLGAYFGARRLPWRP